MDYLIRKVVRMSFFYIILDSIAAEHAARTIAMQIASDNADELLYDLNLEFNKTRQQQITNELLDLIGGSVF
ncbi:MAG: F0F1 ATP synthase subunit gamma [Bacteroidales bacterium]